jgi:hypothetical protein
MPTSLQCAQKIKDDVESPVPDDEIVEIIDWFSNEPYKIISAATIAFHDDDKYRKWRSPGDSSLLYHYCDIQHKLVTWIRSISVEELARRLGESTPARLDAYGSCPAFEFTPWQRLLLMYWHEQPGTATSIFRVPAEAIHSIAGYHESDRKPTEGIFAQWSRLEGFLPAFTINDVIPGGGKTAMSIAMMLKVLSDPEAYTKAVSDYRNRCICKPFEGPPVLLVARMAILATAPSTFDHFVVTAKRLKPVFLEMYSHAIDIKVWDKVSQPPSTTYSVETAADLPANTIVLWIVPIKKMMKVLRRHPLIAVAGLVADEFTVDAPRASRSAALSPWITFILNQATPQMLTGASRGTEQNILRQQFGPPKLFGPHEICNFIRYRQFKEAKIAAEQLCKLDMMTVTAFRRYIRADLQQLMPTALYVHVVKSRRRTMSAYLRDAAADFVPVSLETTLRRMLYSFQPTAESLAELSSFIQSRVFNVAELVETLRNMRSADTRNGDHTVAMTRLVERIEEFHTDGCGICMESDANVDLRIFGCCGYVICSGCFSRAHRCFFCRTPIPTSYTREEVMMVTPSVAEEARAASLASVDASEGSTLQSVLANPVFATRSIQENLDVAFIALKHFGYRRIIVVMETCVYSGQYNDFALANLTSIASRNNINITIVNQKLTGKGTEFSQLKTRYDNDADPQTMALVSLGDGSGLLVGTDLGCTDAIITIGNVSSSLITQTIGRIFRPKMGRDHSRPPVMIRLTSN